MKYLLKKLLLTACVCSPFLLFAQQADTNGLLEKVPDDEASYQLNHLSSLSSLSVILPDTKPTEWPSIRKKIYTRIIGTWGRGPVELKPDVNKFEEVSRYTHFGLTHIKFRYQIVDDIWTEAIMVLPPGFVKTKLYTAVLTIHGTNGKNGKLGVLDVTARKNIPYAIELANKGYITFSPDLLGYGSTIENTSQAQLVADLLKKYPQWSYRAVRILTLIRAIDVLEQMPFTNKGAYGSIGLSLGGSSALFHAAVDERIKASVPAAGVSPAVTNVFRLAPKGLTEEPLQWKKINLDGKPVYDVHEILALCAPRALLIVEPFNDPYNPDVMASFNAVYQAMTVYRLIGVPSRISMLVHGDGHETMPDIRAHAYRWLDKFLPVK